MTPYIFDDRCDFRDVADAMMYWYKMDSEIRYQYGMEGRDWVCGDESNMSAKGMSKRMSECIEDCFKNWTPRKRASLYKVEQVKQIEMEAFFNCTSLHTVVDTSSACRESKVSTSSKRNLSEIYNSVITPHHAATVGQ